jgi:hypothetical protein
LRPSWINDELIPIAGTDNDTGGDAGSTGPVVAGVGTIVGASGFDGLAGVELGAGAAELEAAAIVVGALDDAENCCTEEDTGAAAGEVAVGTAVPQADRATSAAAAITARNGAKRDRLGSLRWAVDACSVNGTPESSDSRSTVR